MSSTSPPTKRRLVEADGGVRRDHVDDDDQSRRGPALAARQRFLSTLAAFASDSDSDDEPTLPVQNNARQAAPVHSGSTIFGSGDGMDTDDANTVQEHRPVVNALVGRELLQQMFQEQKQQQQLQKQPQTRQSGKPPTPVLVIPRVVEAYVPLSTGGFLDTTDETIHLQHLKVGAILCRKPTFTPSKASLAAEATGHSSPAAPAASTPASLSSVLDRFKSHTNLSAEERLYGKALTPDMADHLFEVSRVDLAQQVVEGVFLDGSRQKLRASELRTAGFVEQRLFQQWKAEPSSRPAQRVVVAATAVPSADGAEGSVAGTAAASAPVAWWVLPNLLVRVVAEEAGERWLGQKCLVESVRRKEGKVRLRAVSERDGKLVPSASPADVLEVFGLSGVETVVPKKGGQGLLVAGEHRGEVVTVRSRVRDGHTGELTSIEVVVTRTEEVLHVAPHELCEMRRS